MILKSLLEQEITKDVIEYTIFSASYLVKPDSNVASAILNKLYNLIYDAKLYVRIFEDLNVALAAVIIYIIPAYVIIKKIYNFFKKE